jgi:hypothetical protein
MRVKTFLLIAILLVSCTHQVLPENGETLNPPVASCPPAQLIYDIPAPNIIDELKNQYFSHPIPQSGLKDIRFKLMHYLMNSESHVIAEIMIGEQSTLVLGKFVCKEKYDQATLQSYSFYQIKSIVLAPIGKEREWFNLNTCLVDGKYDGNVVGWGYYAPNINEMKRPQFAWRANELTGTIEEISTENVECQFNGGS